MTMEKIKTAEVLQEYYNTPASIHDGEYSKTTQFMTPAIGVNLENKLVFKYFKNAFLTDVEHEHNYTRPIFLLFSIRDFKEPDWNKVYEKLVLSPNYITEYDVGIKDNKYLLMMVFKVPEIYSEDYVNFRLGRYSLFSNAYKKKFSKWLDSKNKVKDITWQVIHKDPELKRVIEKQYGMEEGGLDKTDIKDGKIYSGPALEIWEKPLKEREYYRYKQKTNYNAVFNCIFY